MTTKDAKPKRTRARRTKAAESAPDPSDETGSPQAPEAPLEPVVEPVVRPLPPTLPEMSAEEREMRLSELNQVIVFRLGGQRYALPIECVQEIQQIVAISEMPGAGGAVLGVINLRGHVIPAIDMRLLLGLPYREADLQTPMVVAYTSQGLAALIVDEVEDVIEVPSDCVQAPSAMHALADRLLAVCTLDDGLVFVFDMDRLVSPDAVTGVTA